LKLNNIGLDPVPIAQENFRHFYYGKPRFPGTFEHHGSNVGSVMRYILETKQDGHDA
jgi:hypothetical protein